MYSKLMAWKVVFVQEAMATHFTGVLAFPMTLHVLVQVQLGLERFPTLSTGKVPATEMSHGHMPCMGPLGEGDMPTQVAGNPGCLGVLTGQAWPCCHPGHTA